MTCLGLLGQAPRDGSHAGAATVLRLPQTPSSLRFETRGRAMRRAISATSPCHAVSATYGTKPIFPIDREHGCVAVGVTGAHEPRRRIGLEQRLDVRGLQPAAETATTMRFNDARVALPDDGRLFRTPAQLRISGELIRRQMPGTGDELPVIDREEAFLPLADHRWCDLGVLDVQPLARRRVHDIGKLCEGNEPSLGHRTIPKLDGVVLRLRTAIGTPVGHQLGIQLVDCQLVGVRLELGAEPGMLKKVPAGRNPVATTGNQQVPTGLSGDLERTAQQRSVAMP